MRSNSFEFKVAKNLKVAKLITIRADFITNFILIDC